MNIIEIITKKKNKQVLSQKEIDFFVQGYTNNTITDYQAAALIMAIYINGMTEEETLNLTISMTKSGNILDLSDIAENIVDKHSTGGIGDKVTLIAMPIIASLGIPVVKMSGRGLGITGGTEDKLEAIPGYHTRIPIEELKQNVKDIGISLVAQTEDLVPADKKLYALRDAIGCVDSIPLIASSIMSKKIALGANGIVLDITCGKGAFMQDICQARELAKMCAMIGKLAKKQIVCVLTNMDEPLGYAVGNTLEVIEAVKALQGEMAEDVKEVVVAIVMQMMYLSGKYPYVKENEKKVMEVIRNGRAYEKLKELVQKQGGDVNYIENIENFPKAPWIEPVIAEKTGWVETLDAEIVGEIGLLLGIGRQKKEDAIDPM